MISFGMPTLIELNSLEESAALCRELQCQPGDLLEFKEE